MVKFVSTVNLENMENDEVEIELLFMMEKYKNSMHYITSEFANPSNNERCEIIAIRLWTKRDENKI